MGVRLKLLFTLFISFFIIAPNSHGYMVGRVRFTEQDFYRHIIPQLKSISNDFQTILKTYAETEEELINLGFQQKRIVWDRYESYLEKCHAEINEDCLTEIKKLEADLSRFESFLDREIYQKFKRILNQFDIDQYFRIQFDLMSIVIQIHNKLQAIKLKGIFATTVNQDARKEIEHLFYQLDHQIGALYIELSPEDKRQDFRKVYTSFIIPIRDKLIIGKYQDYLKENLKELNLTWNEFNMVLLKKSGETSKKQESILNVVQNRWNSILRVVMQP